MEPDHEVRKLRKCLHRASRSLSSTWDQAQAGCLANTGIKYASIATVAVWARAFHSGLRTLWVQALRVGTCACTQQADQLAKHANSIPISNRSLFGEGLCSVIARAASTARYYAAMADGLVQGRMYKPTTPKGRNSCKSRREGSPPPFHGGNRRPTTGGWRNRSSSKGRKPVRDRTPKSDPKSSRGPSPQLASCASPGAKPEVVRDAVVRTPKA